MFFQLKRQDRNISAVGEERLGLISSCLSKQLNSFLFVALKFLPSCVPTRTLPLWSLSSVVYEHRSRLEKSLQKERLEHKKAKEGEEHPPPAETAADPGLLFLKEGWNSLTGAFFPFRLPVLQTGSTAVAQQGEGTCPASADV